MGASDGVDLPMVEGIRFLIASAVSLKSKGAGWLQANKTVASQNSQLIAYVCFIVDSSAVKPHHFAF